MNERARPEQLMAASRLPDAEGLALLRRAARAWADWLPGWEAELAAMAAGGPGWLPPGRPRFAVGAAGGCAERVVARLRLPPALREAWLLCAAVSLDATLAGGLQQRFGQAGLTPALLAEVVAMPLAELLAVCAEHPLRQLGLWRPCNEAAPLALQALRVPDTLALALWGLRDAPPSAAWRAPTEAPLAALAALLQQDRQLALLWIDADGSGCAPELLAPRCRRLQPGDDLSAQLGACLVDDRLPLIELPAEADTPLRLPDAYPGPLLLLASTANPPVLLGRRSLLRQLAPPPPQAEAARQWQQALALPATPAASSWAQRLARQLPLPRDECLALADDARLIAGLQGSAPDEAALLAAAQARAALRISGAVQLRPARAGLSQLVLGAGAQAALARALRLFEAEPEAGLRLLLAGPPGTGKTLAAEALASELGRDLLCVDAGRIWSKWLGETERQLEQVFAAAERSRALLFIDEADALFARRSEVKDAHDRYANAGTAYLLQRVERFRGLLVLASNARGAIDPAFTRRFDAVIAFDEPDEAARARLWAQLLGRRDTTPLSRDAACALLARWYPLTGAQIRAACRQAGAESQDAEPPLSALLAAIAHEFHKAGRAFPGLPNLD
jgi:hypothetical protein